VYHLDYNDYASLSDTVNVSVNREFNSLPLKQAGDMYSTDSLPDFIYRDYEETGVPDKGYYNSGVYKSNITGKSVLFEGSLPECDPQRYYLVSFWFRYINRDLYPRTFFDIECLDKNNWPYSLNEWRISMGIKIIDGEWGLFEYRFKLEKKDDKLRVVLYNSDLRKGDLIIDNLLIRPENKDLYYRTSRFVFKNDRFYPEK
jgi:hypothetical protein